MGPPQYALHYEELQRAPATALRVMLAAVGVDSFDPASLDRSLLTKGGRPAAPSHARASASPLLVCLQVLPRPSPPPSSTTARSKGHLPTCATAMHGSVLVVRLCCAHQAVAGLRVVALDGAWVGATAGCHPCLRRGMALRPRHAFLRGAQHLHSGHAGKHRAAALRCQLRCGARRRARRSLRRVASLELAATRLEATSLAAARLRVRAPGLGSALRTRVWAVRRPSSRSSRRPSPASTSPTKSASWRPSPPATPKLACRCRRAKPCACAAVLAGRSSSTLCGCEGATRQT